MPILIRSGRQRWHGALAQCAGAQFARFVSPGAWPHGLPVDAEAEEIARPDGWEEFEWDGEDMLGEHPRAYKLLAFAERCDDNPEAYKFVESVYLGVLPSGSLVRIRAICGCDSFVSVSEVSLHPVTEATQIPTLKVRGDDGVLRTPRVQSTQERLTMLRDAPVRGLGFTALLR